MSLARRTRLLGFVAGVVLLLSAAAVVTTTFESDRRMQAATMAQSREQALSVLPFRGDHYSQFYAAGRVYPLAE